MLENGTPHKHGSFMSERLDADICIIGGGSGGLSVAAGAAQLGARTVLVERGRMGGDCLNFGCVPSKSLIAVAERAHVVRDSLAFGIEPAEPRIDMKAVRHHVRSVIAAIEPHDSVERFEGLGVRVIRAHGRLAGTNEVEAGGIRIRARRLVIATGSSPAIPPIPGLAEVDFLTNETIFDLDELPDHLLVLGAGPVGTELAQAFRRLGAAVTLVDAGPMLAREEPCFRSIVRDSLIRDGVAVRDNVRVERIEAGPAIVLADQAGGARIGGSHLLVATGRRPNIGELDLELAGIAHDASGIRVDARLRTTNRRVFAIGDVAGPHAFTHMAGYHAGIVIRNALFRLPAKVNHDAVPRVTYTDPELAHVGLTASEAKARGIAHETVETTFADNDRARAERATGGRIRVVATPRGRVLGATIAGRQAGELLLPWSMAIDRRMKLSAMASTIVAYPTLSEINKRVAGLFYAPKLFGERTRCIVRWLGRLG